MHEMKESQEQCCLLHESVTVKIRDNPPLFFNKCAWKYFHLETSRRHTVRYFITKITVQQGLEIHGLEEHGPWRYTVFNWIPKHLRYTVFGQKP